MSFTETTRESLAEAAASSAEAQNPLVRLLEDRVASLQRQLERAQQELLRDKKAKPRHPPGPPPRPGARPPRARPTPTPMPTKTPVIPFAPAFLR